MRKKLPSIPHLEKRLDKIFSVYIRRRTADEGGTVSCVTCRRLLFWKEAHCGHFVKRQHRALRWRPTNCAVQCPQCNLYKGGAQDEYAKFIIQTYGLAEFNDLMESKHKVVKHTRADLEAMIEKYKNEVKAMDMKEAA